MFVALLKNKKNCGKAIVTEIREMKLAMSYCGVRFKQCYLAQKFLKLTYESYETTKLNSHQ